jgi:hypothetical protein
MDHNHPIFEDERARAAFLDLYRAACSVGGDVTETGHVALDPDVCDRLMESAMDITRLSRVNGVDTKVRYG